MNNILLTFDYELFGSGSGDVIKHLIEPTNKILLVLDKLKVKATFFVEQLEIDALISLKNTFPAESKEFMDAIAIEEQISLIIKKGHDIQLHLHPQWYGADYYNGKWNLNFYWWRFSALPYTSNNGVPGKYELIKEGKASLEKRIKPLKPDYQCHTFRAGGYNIGSEKTSVDALVDNGFKIDTSICPGYFSSSALSQYDYTAVASESDHWLSRETFLHPSFSEREVGGCIELPLITIKSSILEKLSFSRIYSGLRNRKYKAIKFTDERSHTKPMIESALKNTNYDVCLSSFIQVRRFNHYIKESADGNDSYVVLIGHPKDYSVFSPMPKILRGLRKSNEFITASDLVRGICK